MLCDIDHFKKVNDEFGHNAGDAVLVELSNIFLETLRKQDTVARWGGEEFLFILPQTQLQNATVIAEKLRQVIQNHLFHFEGIEIKVTVSIGIDQLDDDKDIDQVISNADKRLYQARDAGRNRICPKV